MSKPVISVEHLSKAYRIGLEADAQMNFRERLLHTLQHPLRRMRRFNEDYADDTDTHWALRDVSFGVEEGEVVGIIGRNGAGKSTLLKILSRITEPTQGLARMRGRCSSLLEVGTGFHPELTGRENIFLNGAILGMKRSEIKAKFEQIVEFSEVGKYLDTPVKRYSSGMYVRLAFSVAAHLDPDIMIVDEVLAVGDAAFQKKCLGKMSDVVRQGRTILFVSHSMDSVAALCSSVIVVKKGQVEGKQPTEDGIREYLNLFNDGADKPLAERARTQRNKQHPPIFRDLRVSSGGKPTHVISAGGDVTFEIDLAGFDDVPGNLTAALAVLNHRGQRVALFHSEYHQNLVFRGAARKTLRCHVPALPLAPGSYHLELVLADGFSEVERVERAGTLDVLFADLLGTGKLPNHKQSTVVLPCSWDEQ
jgi:lipopolysaccharide transport system ATP-binding protein